MDKDLFSQLNKLKEIGPDDVWKENNRNILKSQISCSGSSQEAKLRERVLSQVFYLFKSFRSYVFRPAWAGVAALLIVLLGGGAIVQASGDAKPGTFLYYARIAKEKTQIVTTFDEKEKNKLNLKFASEHAKDISEVLNEKGSQSTEETEKLARSFEDSLESVKISLKEMGIKEKEGEEEGSDYKEGEEEQNVDFEKQAGKETPVDSEAKEENISFTENESEEGEDNSSASETNLSETEEGVSEEFFTVDSGRAEEGMDVYDPSREGSRDNEQILISEEKSTSSQVSEKIENAEDLVEENYNSEKLNNLIQEAENLFKEGEYIGAKEKIEELMVAVESGEVLDGEEEQEEKEEATATSAPEDTSTSSAQTGDEEK